jgi:predicted RNase H-like nuclease
LSNAPLVVDNPTGQRPYETQVGQRYGRWKVSAKDLIDALLCACTAAHWSRHGTDRSQVLGPPADETNPAVATIIAPARAEQRR